MREIRTRLTRRESLSQFDFARLKSELDAIERVFKPGS